MTDRPMPDTSGADRVGRMSCRDSNLKRPMWGIRVATRASVAREGEHADDAPIWTRVHGHLTFTEEHLAWEACDDLDNDEDGMLVHRPVEIEQ